MGLELPINNQDGSGTGTADTEFEYDLGNVCPTKQTNRCHTSENCECELDGWTKEQYFNYNGYPCYFCVPPGADQTGRGILEACGEGTYPAPSSMDADLWKFREGVDATNWKKNIKCVRMGPPQFHTYFRDNGARVYNSATTMDISSSSNNWYGAMLLRPFLEPGSFRDSCYENSNHINRRDNCWGITYGDQSNRAWEKTGTGNGSKPDQPGKSDGQQIGDWTWRKPLGGSDGLKQEGHQDSGHYIWRFHIDNNDGALSNNNYSMWAGITNLGIYVHDDNGWPSRFGNDYNQGDRHTPPIEFNGWALRVWRKDKQPWLYNMRSYMNYDDADHGWWNHSGDHNDYRYGGCKICKYWCNGNGNGGHMQVYYLPITCGYRDAYGEDLSGRGCNDPGSGWSDTRPNSWAQNIYNQPCSAAYTYYMDRQGDEFKGYDGVGDAEGEDLWLRSSGRTRGGGDTQDNRVWETGDYVVMEVKAPKSTDIDCDRLNTFNPDCGWIYYSLEKKNSNGMHDQPGRIMTKQWNFTFKQNGHPNWEQDHLLRPAFGRSLDCGLALQPTVRLHVSEMGEWRMRGMQQPAG